MTGESPAAVLAEHVSRAVVAAYGAEHGDVAGCEEFFQCGTIGVEFEHCETTAEREWFIEKLPGDATGWLAALRDPMLSRALLSGASGQLRNAASTDITGLIYTGITQMRDESQGRSGLMATLALVTGVYFTWFWSRGGQTVAMKAWHIRLVDRDGAPVTQARAFARFLLSWLWFLPALATLWLAGVHGGLAVSIVVLTGVLGYALLSRLNAERQFWHDMACGTRLVTWRPAPR